MFRNLHFHPCRRPAPCTRRSCGRSVRPKHRVAPCDIYPDSRRALRQPLPQRPAAEPSAAGKSAARSSESRFPATAFSDCPTAVSSSALPTCPSRSEAGFAPATAHTVLKGRNTPHANSLRSPQSAPSRAQPSTVAARPLRSAPAGTSAERSPPQTSARSVRAAAPRRTRCGRNPHRARFRMQRPPVRTPDSRRNRTSIASIASIAHAAPHPAAADNPPGPTADAGSRRRRTLRSAQSPSTNSSS